MKAIIYLLLVIISTFFYSADAQKKISFLADDGLKVTADEYFVTDTLPWILMFHQSASSRGEFREIAPKLNMLGYNGLAVDLRHGKEINFVANETNQAARRNNYSMSMKDASKDIAAAIKWVAGRSETPCILFGSSFSASLAMIKAKENIPANAVIAFSPGEFFGHPGVVKKAVENLKIPVFIAATKQEYPFVTELSSGIDAEKKTIFSPSTNTGTHGARALWESEECNQEYWLSLLMFLNRINN